MTPGYHQPCEQTKLKKTTNLANEYDSKRTLILLMNMTLGDQQPYQHTQM